MVEDDTGTIATLLGLLTEPEAQRESPSVLILLQIHCVCVCMGVVTFVIIVFFGQIFHLEQCLVPCWTIVHPPSFALFRFAGAEGE